MGTRLLDQFEIHKVITGGYTSYLLVCNTCAEIIGDPHGLSLELDRFYNADRIDEIATTAQEHRCYGSRGVLYWTPQRLKLMLLSIEEGEL